MNRGTKNNLTKVNLLTLKKNAVISVKGRFQVTCLFIWEVLNSSSRFSFHKRTLNLDKQSVQCKSFLNQGAFSVRLN